MFVYNERQIEQLAHDFKAGNLEIRLGVFRELVLFYDQGIYVLHRVLQAFPFDNYTVEQFVDVARHADLAIGRLAVSSLKASASLPGDFLDAGHVVRTKLKLLLQNLPEDQRPIPELLDLIDNPPENSAPLGIFVESVRHIAILALENTSDLQAIEMLLTIYQDSSDPDREVAGSSLQGCHNPRLVPVFIQALDDKDRNISRQAIRMLGTIIDERALEPLITKLSSPRQQERQWAGEALVNYPREQVIARLLENLRSPDKLLRRAATIGLMQVANEQCVLPLIHALNDPYKTVRYNAAIALGRIGDLRAVEPLLKTIKDVDSRTRGAAASALGILGDSRALQPIIHAFYDGTRTVRLSALYGLFGLHAFSDPRRLKQFLEALEDENMQVRFTAYMSAGNVNHLKAVKLIVQRIKERSNDREQVTVYLHALGNMNLKDFGEEAISLIGRLSNSENEQVRNWAQHILKFLLQPNNNNK
jgi:HEAT repeat protein